MIKFLKRILRFFHRQYLKYIKQQCRNRCRTCTERIECWSNDTFLKTGNWYDPY